MWAKFYQSRVCNKSYECYFNDKYAPFLDILRASNGGNYLEVGCGTGLVTKLIHKANCHYTLLDKDMAMLRLAQMQGIKSATLKKGDIRSPISAEVDVVYSHGVLEHLSLVECKSIITNQLTKGKVLVHYVPTNKYKVPSFGDENLISKAQWEDTLKPTESLVFNHGKDLVLIWR